MNNEIVDKLEEIIVRLVRLAAKVDALNREGGV